MEQLFVVGSKVQLKAGGPVMSVHYVNIKRDENSEIVFSGSYDCQWFAGKKLDKGTFRQENLVEVK